MVFVEHHEIKSGSSLPMVALEQEQLVFDAHGRPQVPPGIF
jgi:hypothetical protein